MSLFCCYRYFATAIVISHMSYTTKKELQEIVDKLVIVICRYEVLMDLLIDPKYLPFHQQKINEIKEQILGAKND